MLSLLDSYKNNQTYFDTSTIGVKIVQRLPMSPITKKELIEIMEDVGYSGKLSSLVSRIKILKGEYFGYTIGFKVSSFASNAALFSHVEDFKLYFEKQDDMYVGVIES